MTIMSYNYLQLLHFLDGDLAVFPDAALVTGLCPGHALCTVLTGNKNVQRVHCVSEHIVPKGQTSLRRYVIKKCRNKDETLFLHFKSLSYSICGIYDVSLFVRMILYNRQHTSSIRFVDITTSLYIKGISSTHGTLQYRTQNMSYYFVLWKGRSLLC